MKNGIRILLIGLLTGIKSTTCCAQITAGNVEQYLLQSKVAEKEKLSNFYSGLAYRTAWIQKQDRENLGSIAQCMGHAEGFGLNYKDYDVAYIRLVLNNGEVLKTTADSLEAELKITAIALHFYTDLRMGNLKPVFGYTGIKDSSSSADISSMLSDFILNRKIARLADTLSAGIPEIKVLENKLQWMIPLMSDSSFSEITNLPVKIARDNRELLLKLFQLGITDSIGGPLADSSVIRGVKKAQQMFGLLPDGIIRSTLIRELNIPVSVRIQQLNYSINHYRWMNYQLRSEPVVSVNIPAAYMKVYTRNSVILEMKMVVGKTSTPTPTLASTITEVILYPYWHVPFSIATKELLPQIKADPAYLNNGGFQVLDKKGKVIEPSSVNWKALSKNYFPYTIRQSTGCDNALGLLKINFYSPYGVYLHDTPMKNGFSMNKRFFSHGCMRMQKPMELGYLLLHNNSIAIDTLDQKSCLRNQAPVIVPVKNRMPVIVWYNPAGTDAAGRVVFYQDIYDRFHW